MITSSANDLTLRVATFNANSIRVRLPQILDWTRRHQPDILAIQETKVQDAQFPVDPIRENGYQVAFRGQKSHAGVAVLSRHPLEEVHFGFDDEPRDEARMIRFRVLGIPIVNTYVPQGRAIDSPQFEYKLEWLARLGDLFARCYDPQAPLLWVGDLNVAPEPIDLHNPKRNENHVCFHSSVRAALEHIRDWGFIDLFRLHHPDEPGHYTFWDYRVRNALDRNLGWRVDHIWATAPLAQRCKACWIDVEARRAPRPSDHTFLVADFSF